jgi:hypothetical protein
MNSTRGSNENLTAQSGLTRRHFLRGLGACLALPAFESLGSLKALASTGSAAGKLATTATGAPLRTAFIFFPNGAIPSAWWPEEKEELALSPTMQPLEQSRKLIQVLGGMDHVCANPGADGAGDHARGNGVFLTGVRLKKSATDIRAGTSIDQVLAAKIGHLTRFPSLELSCDHARRSSACDSNYSCAYQYNLSWSSPTTPVAAEANPRLVFERLFGAGKHGERAAIAKRRQADQQSVLDFVLDDARRMQGQLDAHDKDKLDQYLTGVRAIESRIQKAERFATIPDPDIDAPPGIPSDHAEHMQLMYDMLVLAFQTDSTRMATFLLAHDGDNRSYSEIGIPEGHHDLSHHQNKAEQINKVAEIDKWYSKQFAKFLLKMQETKDIDGNSLLHNSMIVYGGGNADANRHTHTNLPVILAGAGGGTLTPGRFVQHVSKPMTNLFLTMSDKLGVSGIERFGDSTGRLVNV